MSKKKRVKSILSGFLAGAMMLGIPPIDAIATVAYQVDQVNFIEFDVFQIKAEDLATNYIVKYQDIYFDDYGNKHETIVIFEPSYEFKKYLLEYENSANNRRLEHRESFMGNLGVNTVRRTAMVSGVQKVMSFQFDLVTTGGSAIRRIQNARNFAFSATAGGVSFSSPSLNIAREYDTGSGNLLGEVNASVQATRSLGSTSTLLLTARVTQSGLIRVYSNF